MKLMTKAVEKSLPPLYATDGIPAADKLVVQHYFVPWGAGDWFVVEGERVGEDDFLMYNYGGLPEPEWGYVSLNEMLSVKGPFGLGIERDMHWTPKVFSEIK
jgi:hypothetical protein